MGFKLVIYSKIGSRGIEFLMRTAMLCLIDRYRIVESSNTSRLEAHLGFFRFLIKGKFDPYVL